MKKQFFYIGLLGAAALTACTSEELEFEQGKLAANWETARPKINVVFTAPTDTRFAGGADLDPADYPGKNIKTIVDYTTSDNLGAVLVDFDYSDATDYWKIKDTHVGNNKFTYDKAAKKFVTAGTMVKGTWVMYSPYDAAMTTSRDGIKFTPNVVQKWASDVSEIAKIDFRVSPACEIDGYEGGSFQDAINLQSVYAYTNIQLEFDKEVKVQKLVVKPREKFAKVYKIQNTKFDAVTAGGFYGVVTANSKNTSSNSPSWSTRMDRAQKAMRLNETYNAETFVKTSANLPLVNAVASPAEKDLQDIWALDCEKAPAGKTFQGYMALPEGAYAQIDVYAYTDKGVYKFTVDNDHKATTDANEVTTKMLYLRGNFNVELGRVNSNCPEATKNDKVLPKALAINMTNAVLKTVEETNGTVVISQKDLIDVINGIAEDNVAEIRVLQNGDNKTVKINKDVMAALDAKQQSKPGAVLKFKDSEIVIEGDATPYELHDVIFTEGCKLTKDNIKIGNNVKVGDGKKFIIKAGATATIVKNGKCNNSKVEGDETENEYQTLENNGTLTVSAGNAVVTLPEVKNAGTITVESATLVRDLTNNSGKNVTVATTGSLSIYALANNGTITNNKELNMLGVGTFANAGTINNVEGTLGISAVVDNTGTITNAASQTILVSTKYDVDGILNNTTGTITNHGYMFCHEGKNKIHNTGKIYAKAGSTTYITTNSSEYETDCTVDGKKITATPVNDANMKMGTIYLDSRDEDISVTTKNRKGYIIWESNGAALGAKSGDKFNYVILPNNATTTVPSGSYAKYIEVNGGKITLEGNNYGSIKFNAATTVYANPGSKVTVGSLTVAEKVVVKIPTENALGVYSLSLSNNYFESKVNAEIKNAGTLLVGGDFYSSMALPATGTFASGDGQATAFHWGTATW